MGPNPNAIDLTRVSAAEVHTWCMVAVEGGDAKLARCLADFERAIVDDDLEGRIGAMEKLFEMLVLERGIGL